MWSEGDRGAFRSPAGEGAVLRPFLLDAALFTIPIQADLAQPLYLFLLKEGAPLSQPVIEWTADVTCICINICGGSMARSRSASWCTILRDELLEMRRLAEIFYVDIAAVHELWMPFGVDAPEVEAHMEQDIELVRQCADTVIGAVYEEHPILCLSTPCSLRDTERVIWELLERARETSLEAVIVG